MNIRPIRDQVVVELEPLQEVSAGGIHLPAAYAQGNRPDARWGKVLGAGPKCGLVKSGDRVLVNGWLNDSAKSGHGYGGKDSADSVVFIQEKDIFAIDDGTPS